jgi:hypothetical protein
MRLQARSFAITAILGLAATSSAKGPGAAGDKKAIDPVAIKALEGMGAFLRDQPTFNVQLTIETDHVLPSGQKIRVPARGELLVRRPDHLRAAIRSDRKEREFFYDGKTLVMNGPQLGYYARIPAPPTILELADTIQGRYGLELPMVDLFRWGTDEADIGQITAAAFVGTAKLDGVDTDQYAFRQPGLDWQIWIDHGDRPLPHKIVLTTTDDKTRPERSIAMRWDLHAKAEDAQFAFTPPDDSREIPLAELKKHHEAVAAKDKVHGKSNGRTP